MSAAAHVVSGHEVDKLTKQLIGAVLVYTTDAARMLFYIQWHTLVRDTNFHVESVLTDPRAAMQEKSNALQQVYTALSTSLHAASATALVDTKSRDAEKAYIDMKFLTSFSVLEAHWNCVKTVVNGYLIDLNAALQELNTMQTELAAMFGPSSASLGGVCTKWNRLWQLRMGPSAPVLASPVDTVNSFLQHLDKKQENAAQLQDDAEELRKVAQYCANTGTVLQHAHTRIEQSGIKAFVTLAQKKQEQFAADAMQCVHRLGTERVRRMKAAYPTPVAVTDVALQIDALKRFEAKTKQLVAAIAAELESKMRRT